MRTLEETEIQATGSCLGDGAVHEAKNFQFTPESATRVQSSGSKALDCICDGGQDCAPDRTRPRKRITTALLAFVGLSRRQPTLEEVTAYTFEPVIHRMIDKHCWPEWLAREVFEEYKKYAWLCVTTGQHLAPTKVIDEVWHNHILFTQDYTLFCNTVLGTFLHHRPSRRGEKSEGESARITQLTRRVATQAFGKLSKHWEFHQAQTCDGNTGCDGKC